MKQILSTIAAISVAFAIWGLSVTLTMAATFTYPAFSAGLVNSHDLTDAQMQQNYSAIVKYSMFPWVHELSFDSLPMSAAGAQHFAEAKAIFQIFILGGLLALLIALVLGAVLRHSYKTSSFLTAGGIIALVVPIVLSIPVLFDFDRTFITFHRMAFNNDLWMFDPQTDPIINYLPESLFMKNAILIALLMIILAVIAIILGRLLDPSRRLPRSADLAPHQQAHSDSAMTTSAQ